jgi:hypothetical protein
MCHLTYERSAAPNRLTVSSQAGALAAGTLARTLPTPLPLAFGVAFTAAGAGQRASRSHCIEIDLNYTRV